MFAQPPGLPKQFYIFLTQNNTMKKYLPLLIVLLLAAVFVSAQGVSVSATPAAPDASAILDVNSTAKGFLPPRMTTVQRDAITTPATGLVIYNTTTGCLNYWKQTAWYEVCGTCAPQPTQSNAGLDQLNLAGTSAVLAANTPTNGTGAWSIVSGTGGSFVNAALATTTFNGTTGQFYTLRWTITTGCGNSTNDVDVSFGASGSNLITLAALRQSYTADLKIGSSTQITGVVISDTNTKNISKGSVILQQGTAGINVFFGSSVTNTYALGDSVVIDITGDSLINFKGALEIKATAAQRSVPVATNKTIVPAQKTIKQLTDALATPLNSATNIEYTLVKVINATITGTGTYSGTSGANTFTDLSTGSMTFFAKTGATFVGLAYPTTPSSYTGYSYNFNATPEFQMRNPTTDVQ